MVNNLVSDPILAYLAQIWAATVFFKKSGFVSVPKYHGQLSSCTTLEKSNDPILRKYSDGWTN